MPDRAPDDDPNEWGQRSSTPTPPGEVTLADPGDLDCPECGASDWAVSADQATWNCQQCGFVFEPAISD